MRILIIGSLCDDKWIGSLIRSLCKSGFVNIDFFHIVTSKKQLSEASKLCNKVFYVKRHFPAALYSNSKIRQLLSFQDVPMSIQEFVKQQRNEGINYDVMNIHYPQNKVLRCWKEIKSIAKSTIITPWGSEVLRINKFSQYLMSKYIVHYDYIMSSDNERFRNQLKNILHVSDSQFLSCDFGSEMIDEICSKTHVTKRVAKNHFGIDNSYTIVCGYNAGIAQNHIKIINALISVRDKFPKDLVLVLPMTYNGTQAYIEEVDNLLNKNSINHIIFQHYLTNEEMVYLRKCADMFIHGQDTDANSVSLAEHLLCENVVVNGSWLRYENRESFGIPYYLFDTFEELPNVLVKAYNGGSLVSKQLVDAIAEEGWSKVAKKWINIFNNASNKI